MDAQIPECQVVMATKFCILAPTMWGYSASNLLISPFGPIILKWSLDFWNICVPLLYSSTNSKPWHKMEVSGQLYTLTVSWGKEIPLPTG